MAKQTINLGAAPNDGTGDSLRSGGDKMCILIVLMTSLLPLVVFVN